MPELSTDNAHANLSLLAGVLSVTSGVLLLGSLITYATGEPTRRGGHTHTDAALVLLFLGIALAVASLIVFAERKSRRASGTTS